jgi:hypothetical protein
MQNLFGGPVGLIFVGITGLTHLQLGLHCAGLQQA